MSDQFESSAWDIEENPLPEWNSAVKQLPRVELTFLPGEWPDEWCQVREARVLSSDGHVVTVIACFRTKETRTQDLPKEAYEWIRYEIPRSRCIVRHLEPYARFPEV